ncbi:hypothetical protein D3H65_01785 [Paraflavitalea soli]|uniref:Uncharacterized protein n=1 Tax=Paraflavitalea soli TaxID=2315862 RepID=A0A3B7MIA3_9BACT|nr:hypothetical protein [Paraflavitalea soli]AXY72776.1 hypothetical protein D3H65_01785 [Paraflavitalea soli]
MKNLVRIVKNRIEAITGRSILIVYRTYSALFIKQADFTPPHTPVRRQEIILIKRVNNTYNVVGRECFVQ